MSAVFYVIVFCHVACVTSFHNRLYVSHPVKKWQKEESLPITEDNLVNILPVVKDFTCGKKPNVARLVKNGTVQFSRLPDTPRYKPGARAANEPYHDIQFISAAGRWCIRQLLAASNTPKAVLALLTEIRHIQLYGWDGARWISRKIMPWTVLVVAGILLLCGVIALPVGTWIWIQQLFFFCSDYKADARRVRGACIAVQFCVLFFMMIIILLASSAVLETAPHVNAAVPLYCSYVRDGVTDLQDMVKNFMQQLRAMEADFNCVVEYTVKRIMTAADRVDEVVQQVITRDQVKAVVTDLGQLKNETVLRDKISALEPKMSEFKLELSRIHNQLKKLSSQLLFRVTDPDVRNILRTSVDRVAMEINNVTLVYYSWEPSVNWNASLLEQGSRLADILNNSLVALNSAGREVTTTMRRDIAPTKVLVSRSIESVQRVAEDLLGFTTVYGKRKGAEDLMNTYLDGEKYRQVVFILCLVSGLTFCILVNVGSCLGVIKTSCFKESRSNHKKYYGKRITAGEIIMGGVCISWALLWFMLIMGGLLFYVAAVLSVVCEPMMSGTIFHEVFDNPEIWPNGVTPINRALFKNASVSSYLLLNESDVLQKCAANKTIYMAFQLNKRASVDQLVNASALTPDVTVLTAKVTELHSDLLQSFNQLFNLTFQEFQNVTLLFQQINNFQGRHMNAVFLSQVHSTTSVLVKKLLQNASEEMAVVAKGIPLMATKSHQPNNTYKKALASQELFMESVKKQLDNIKRELMNTQPRFSLSLVSNFLSIISNKTAVQANKISLEWHQIFFQDISGKTNSTFQNDTLDWVQSLLYNTSEKIDAMAKEMSVNWIQNELQTVEKLNNIISGLVQGVNSKDMQEDVRIVQSALKNLKNIQQKVLNSSVRDRMLQPAQSVHRESRKLVLYFQDHVRTQLHTAVENCQTLHLSYNNTTWALCAYFLDGIHILWVCLCCMSVVLVVAICISSRVADYLRYGYYYSGKQIIVQVTVPKRQPAVEDKKEKVKQVKKRVKEKSPSRKQKLPRGPPPPKESSTVVILQTRVAAKSSELYE